MLSPDRTTRVVEGHVIVTSGTQVCPSSDLCDVTPLGIKSPCEGPEYQAYVRRHAKDHMLGEFDTFEDAERNLGLNCFYFFHKFIWENNELVPLPHWEIHAFVAESEWSETDLQHRTPLPRRKQKGYLPSVGQRRTTEYRRFKQVEVPRQCQKTSTGARAYPVYRSLREYFVNDRRNYRIIVRSATGKNTRDTLDIVRRMARRGPKIGKLFGVWLMRCGKCGYTEQVSQKLTQCPHCEAVQVHHRRLALIDNSQGSGSTGRDQLSFRWLTDSSDAVAAYSMWVAGLKTTTTGQRPDLYIWDDPQTTENSRTVEMRLAIADRFEQSVDELQFGGEMLVFDTRKYMNDFCGKTVEEPMATQFFSLRREVRWRTDEPDNPPYVVDGWRYYYPIRGNGERALDAKEVASLRKKRNFSAEYMNNPLDEESQKFKRDDFVIVSRSDDRSQWGANQTAALPIEICYGLGREITPSEQEEMNRQRVRINAMNSVDPATDGAQRKKGDDNFLVATRLDRYGKIHITKLAAGHWGSKRRFDEIEKASTYNRAQFTYYEMPVDEDSIEAAFDKWVRDTSERVSEAMGKPVTVRPPMKFGRMPKSGKDERIDQVEMFLPIYILDDAADPDLIEKYISQWVGRGVEDHDDGPDATANLVPFFGAPRWRAPEEEQQKSQDPNDGASYVSLAAIKDIVSRQPQNGLWGEQGVPREVKIA